MAGVASLAAAIMPTLATADVTDRSGQEVVQQTCRACHATGKDGAPKIGDKQAWGKLASRGLSSLTQSALTGVRDRKSTRLNSSHSS